MALYMLVLVALINTIISLYYYLLVVKAMWISADEPKIAGINTGACEKVALTVCVLGIVFLGLVSCVYQYFINSVGTTGLLPLN